jgi:hypothetical protein
VTQGVGPEFKPQVLQKKKGKCEKFTHPLMMKRWMNTFMEQFGNGC